MAKITLEHQVDKKTFPADSILELKIVEADVRTVPGRNGDWEKCECKFKILGVQAIGDGSPVEGYHNWIGDENGYIWGSVPLRLTDSAENKLRIWAEAIFRQELGLGFELDTDLFVGRTVRGITSIYKTKEGRDRHQVETLLPFGGAAPAAAQPAAPAAATPAATTQDPWGDSWGAGDEPPF